MEKRCERCSTLIRKRAIFDEDKCLECENKEFESIIRKS